MGMTRSTVENPDRLQSGIEQDHYESNTPHGDVALGIQKGASTSYERSGAAFTNRQLTQGHVLGKSSQNLSSLAFTNSTPPSFNSL